MHIFKFVLLTLFFIHANVFATTYYLSEGQCNGQNYVKDCSSLNGKGTDICAASFTYYTHTDGVQCSPYQDMSAPGIPSKCYHPNTLDRDSCNLNNAIYTMRGQGGNAMCSCKTFYNNTARGTPNINQRCPNDQVNFQGLCYKACTTKYSMKTAGTCTLNGYP